MIDRIPPNVAAMLHARLALSPSMDALCLALTCRAALAASRAPHRPGPASVVSSDAQLDYAAEHLGLVRAMAYVATPMAAARHGSVHALGMLNFFNADVARRLMASAASAGRLEAMGWVAERARRSGVRLDCTQALVAAARGGHVAALSWLRSKGYRRRVSTPLVRASVSAGHVPVLSWLFEAQGREASGVRPGEWQTSSVARAVLRCESPAAVMSFLAQRGLLRPGTRFHGELQRLAEAEGLGSVLASLPR